MLDPVCPPTAVRGAATIRMRSANALILAGFLVSAVRVFFTELFRSYRKSFALKFSATVTSIGMCEDHIASQKQQSSQTDFFLPSILPEIQIHRDNRKMLHSETSPKSRAYSLFVGTGLNKNPLLIIASSFPKTTRFTVICFVCRST